jgi:hypothetical protein
MWHIFLATSSRERSQRTAWPRVPSPAPQPSFLDGDVKQVGQPTLRVSPSVRPDFAEDLLLCLGPQRSRDLEGTSAFRCEPHRFDPPVGVRRTLDQTIAFQEVETTRERRLIDRQRIFELFEIRLVPACDGRQNAELSRAEAARPQGVVVELRHGAGDHAKRIADTARQPPRILPGRSVSHRRHATTFYRVPASLIHAHTS